VEKLLKRLIHDKRGIAAVAIVAVITIPLTFLVWLISWTPVALMLEVIEPLTTNQNALNIYSMTHTVAGWLLIIEVAVILIWWFASSFRREDQTYRKGNYGY
jgi:lipoprotein signal peptidase